MTVPSEGTPLTAEEVTRLIEDHERNREQLYQEEVERIRLAGTHIRKKAGRSLGNSFYSHAHRAQFAGGYTDPQGQTLCGAPATILDMSYAETQWAKNRTHVTCEDCIAVRIAAGVRN